jgi:carbon-monoxide dehydrogenase medium subunit
MNLREDPMRSFDYHRPATLSEAAALLAEPGEIKALAGGMTLLPAIKLRLAAPDRVIDLAALPDLAGIAREGGSLKIGAMARHAEVAGSPVVLAAIPALARLAGSIGDPAVRNRGTIGGSLANNDPSADYPAAALGLGATIVTSRRALAADDFFRGLFETALEPGEILTGVTFPVPLRAGYAKLRNPASRYPIVGVFVAETKEGVRVAVTGTGGGVFRLPAFEAALSGNFTPDALRGLSVDAAGFASDLHAEAGYRAHLVSVMAGRAIVEALGDPRGA